MNYNKEYITILTLLIINTGDPLNNSYRIIRILDWRFKTTLYTKEILDDIRKKEYVKYNIINGVYYYTLTDRGKKLIAEGFDVTYKFLTENYKGEVETINGLFNSFKGK